MPAGAPGQLETEMSANAWLSVPATSSILFDTPFELRWSAAAGLLGIDLAMISSGDRSRLSGATAVRRAHSCSTSARARSA